MFNDFDLPISRPTLHYPYWYGQPVPGVLWNLRQAEVSWHTNWHHLRNSRLIMNGGWGATSVFGPIPWREEALNKPYFSLSYPVLNPFYPMISPTLGWQGNWATGNYGGYWWP